MPAQFSTGSESRLRQHFVELVDKILHVLKLAVHAGEADERHLVQLSQMLDHQLAQVRGWHFRLAAGVHVAFHGHHDRFDLLIADRALPAGFFQPLADLLPIERSPGAVLLDHLDRTLLAPLERRILPAAGEAFAPAAHRKSPLAHFAFDDPIRVFVAERALDQVVHPLVRVVAGLAGQAFAPAANRKAILAGPRVDDAVVVHSATRTFHGTLGRRASVPPRPSRNPALFPKPTQTIIARTTFANSSRPTICPQPPRAVKNQAWPAKSLGGRQQADGAPRGAFRGASALV